MRVNGAVLVSAIVLPSIASAVPIVQFPVNSQVPPVARASQPYSFTFAESTFTSTAGPITYALSDEPAWLRLDSGSRAFSGSPGSKDVGSVTFELIATDAQGPTPLSVTLVVIQHDGLQVGQSILSQLAGFGIPSSPSSLLFYPLQAFAFNFSSDTFLRTSSRTSYYAISEDNSPLPSWLKFDASVLGFSGTTPPLVSPTATPQTYGMKLVASDVPGFLETSAAFQIVVGYHILSFSVANENINASSDKEVATSPLRETLRLDGKAVPDPDLVSVTANAPSWLVLDQENISLSGVPPANATSFSVTISVTDVIGDIANATIDFTFTSNWTRLFLGDVPVANATIGQDFNYTINRSLLATGGVTLMADARGASEWLAFDPGNLSFSGKVPQDLTPGQIDVALYATLDHETEEENLQINVIRGSATTSTSHTITVTVSAKSLSSSPPGPSTSPSGDNHQPLSRSTRLKIMLAVVLSIVVFILLVTLIICCRPRKQELPTESTADAPRLTPAPPAGEHVEPELLDVGFVESPHGEEIQRHITPDEPPRIELSWAPDSLREAKTRLSKRISARDDSLLNLSFSGRLRMDSASPGHNSRSEKGASQQFNRRSQDLTPFVSTRTPNYSRKRTPLRPVQSKTEEGAAPKRASRALSTISTATFGLPSRLSGAGHGAGGVGLPGYNDIRSSWQDTESSLPSMDSRGMALDIVEAFPQPPVEGLGSRSIRSPQRNGKPGLRLVTTSSSHTESPTDERQRWYKERARDPLERGARFSHARSSRPHSGGRHLEAESSTLGHEDQLASLNSLYGQWSENAAVGASIQPEIMTPRRSPGRPFMRPPSKLVHNRSTASSGQFDSALSTSSSQWEDEILTTEMDIQQEETQYPAESARRGGQGNPLHKSQSRRSATTTARLSEVSSVADLDRSPASRKLRLGDVPGQRPVSVEEGNLQKSQRSHQGSLAFV
jgi:axial budding pattern protein 2